MLLIVSSVVADGDDVKKNISYEKNGNKIIKITSFFVQNDTSYLVDDTIFTGTCTFNMFHKELEAIIGGDSAVVAKCMRYMTIDDYLANKRGKKVLIHTKDSLISQEIFPIIEDEKKHTYYHLKNNQIVEKSEVLNDKNFFLTIIYICVFCLYLVFLIYRYSRFSFRKVQYILLWNVFVILFSMISFYNVNFLDALCFGVCLGIFGTIVFLFLYRKREKVIRFLYKEFGNNARLKKKLKKDLYSFYNFILFSSVVGVVDIKQMKILINPRKYGVFVFQSNKDLLVVTQNDSDLINVYDLTQKKFLFEFDYSDYLEHDGAYFLHNIEEKVWVKIGHDGKIIDEFSYNDNESTKQN